MDHLDLQSHRPRTPAAATSALPGSAEKVATMADRLERGESLWHPRDASGLADRPTWLDQFGADMSPM